MISVPTFSYEAYWTDFDISGEDLDFIYNLLLEREVPLTTEEMSLALVEYRLECLEKEAQEAVEIDYTFYLPVSKYEVGQRVLFPALGNTIGSVVGVRDGENPEVSEFDVIKVKFEETGQQKEFAARLEDHILNNPPDPELNEDELSSVDGVMRMFSRLIEERLIRSLENEEDIVWIAGSWFPKALLADIHEGHLNLAEAVLERRQWRWGGRRGRNGHTLLNDFDRDRPRVAGHAIHVNLLCHRPISFTPGFERQLSVHTLEPTQHS